MIVVFVKFKVKIHLQLYHRLYNIYKTNLIKGML